MLNAACTVLVRLAFCCEASCAVAPLVTTPTSSCAWSGLAVRVALPLACTLGTAVCAAIAEQESSKSSNDKYVRNMHQLYRLPPGTGSWFLRFLPLRRKPATGFAPRDTLRPGLVLQNGTAPAPRSPTPCAAIWYNLTLPAASVEHAAAWVADHRRRALRRYRCRNCYRRRRRRPAPERQGDAFNAAYGGGEGYSAASLPPKREEPAQPLRK